MKHAFNAVQDRNRQIIAMKSKRDFRFIPMAIMIVVVFTACQKQEVPTPNDRTPVTTEEKTKNNHNHDENSSMVSDEQFSARHHSLSRKTLWELLQARAATARYRNLKNAIKDGYEDISVIVPNMGYHYMKSSLKDAKFEVRRPEILVYNKNEDGSLELVAVEYAVPIDDTPNKAPEGFTGNADVWDRNTGFGLWLLHAWVWHYNPDGVFNPTNPLIHVH